MYGAVSCFLAEETDGKQESRVSGIIDPEKGYCKMGGALRYNDDFYFRDALAERCHVPVVVENNAKCAALAEAATYPVFVDAINTNLEEMYMVCPYDIPRAEITVCRFREDASLIGAYHNLRERGAR